MLETAEDVKRYLTERGLAPPDAPVTVEPLGGGVSNQAWKIAGNHFRYVLKQALAKLKVKADWFSDVRRIGRERAAMEAAAPLLGEEHVPRVVHFDEEAHILVMTAGGCTPGKTSTCRIFS